MKRVFIIGAGFLQSFIIKKAKQMGFITICVDGNPNAVGFKTADHYKCIDITNKEACLEYALKMKIDGVLTAGTDYGVLTTSYIAEKMQLIGNPYNVAQTVRNKYLTRKLLFQNNIDDTSIFFKVSNHNELEEVIQKIRFPVIIKPCDGSGSRGVEKVDSVYDLESACIRGLENSLSKEVLIEEYIEGKEYGVEVFVHRNEIYVLAIMEKTMTAPPIHAELGHCSISGLSKTVINRLIENVKKTIKVLGVITGSVNIDLLINRNNKIYIIDVGIRMGGNLIGSHIVPLTTGIDYMANIINESLGLPINLKPIHECKKVIVSRLLTLAPGKVKSIGDLSLIETDPRVEFFKLNIKENDVINEYRSNIDGCGYLVVSGKNIDQAKNHAQYLLEFIDKKIIRY